MTMTKSASEITVLDLIKPIASDCEYTRSYLVSFKKFHTSRLEMDKTILRREETFPSPSDQSTNPLRQGNTSAMGITCTRCHTFQLQERDLFAPRVGNCLHQSSGSLTSGAFLELAKLSL